ncbi:hypothetical protein SHKM778_62020 [Streptomyces sp. KM77-8]|uniref:Uncharacterized protein n=1 Tax=Streptomyces haneummycinicus TaxID=3074435 RepID=A0AAT9HQT1_9ACTN
MLRLDDIASHAEPFDWTGRLRSQVIEPLGRGETARYSPTTGARAASSAPPAAAGPRDPRGGRRRGPPRPAPVSGAAAVDGTPREDSWSRGRARDGAEQREFWDGWVRAEREHFAGDPSRPFAGLLVRQRPSGYELLPGPAGTAEAPPPLTQGDDPPAMW